MSKKKMAETKIMLGWRDKPEIGVALDKVAKDQGIDRSDVIRIIVRNYFKAKQGAERKNE